MATNEELMGLLNEVIERYKPGGGFKEAGLAEIARRKKRTVGKQTQSMIGSGLGGTSQAAVLGSRFEEEVGTPAKLGLEHERIGALTEAMGAKAGYLEREAARETEQERYLKDLALKKRQQDIREAQLGMEQMSTWEAQEQQQKQFEEQMEYKRWKAQLGADTGGGAGGGGLTTHTGAGDSIYGTGGGGSPFSGGVSFSAPGGGYSPVGAGQKPLTNLQQSMFELGYGPVSQQGAEEAAGGMIESAKDIGFQPDFGKKTGGKTIQVKGTGGQGPISKASMIDEGRKYFYAKNDYYFGEPIDDKTAIRWYNKKMSK